MLYRTDKPVDPERVFGREMLANPYPFYHQLRSLDPVHYEEAIGMWILTRYDDVVAALHDHRLAANRIASDEELRAQGPQAGPGRARPANRLASDKGLPESGSSDLAPLVNTVRSQMLFADPPDHMRLRGLVNKAFTPRVVEKMREHIQEIVDKCIDSAQSTGRMDVIADLAYPLPATVIAEMLGVPHKDRERFKRWSDDFSVVLGNISSTPEENERALQSAVELNEYFSGIADELRENPRNDLLSALARAEEEGDRLTEQELLANAILLLIAGHETTTNLIGNGTLALLHHPDQLKMLKDDPALIPDAIEELLRYDSPVQFTGRLAKEDMEVGGKRIEKGQFVLIVLGAANRDPAHFPDPDVLNVRRTEHRHVAFGHGPHFCLGAPLARLEGEIAFRTMLRRMPNIALTDEEPQYRANFNLRGLESLPVAF